MTARAWWSYLAVVTAATMTRLAMPEDSHGEVGFPVAIGLLIAAAMLAGIRRVPVRDRAPWLFFALGLLCAGLAPLPEELGTDWFPGDGPDVSDLLYLGFYPAVAVGLVLMIRQSRHHIDWAALVDALTVTAGIGLLAWAYAIAPTLRDGGTGLVARLVTVAYPIADLVLLAMTILLLRSNGRQGRRAPLLVAGGIGGYLAGDWAWVVVPQLNEGWADLWWVGRLITADYNLSLVVLSLAVIWPQVRGDGLGASAVSQLRRPQLAVLTLAMLVSPALLITQQLTGGIVDGIAIGIGSAIMFLLVMARFVQLLRQAEHQSQVVRELSRRDELTGLPNRRAWIDELPRVLERARDGGAPVVVSMIDLDHFKSFNDTYGHPAGDRLLKRAAAAWNEELRRYDVLARYGGEEFIVLLPGSTMNEATAILERLRAVTPLNQTFSAGLAAWDGTETSESLIARADTALYAAKDAGRDCVCAAPEPTSV